MSTCEVPVEGMPRQPWSSLANALMIVMLLTRKRTKVVGSLILFELVHLAAHGSLMAKSSYSIFAGTQINIATWT